MKAMFVLCLGTILWAVADEPAFELVYTKQLEAPKEQPTTFKAKDEALVVELHGGIASARLSKPAETKWPKTVHLRLHTKGMEFFEIVSGKERISGFVKSHGDFKTYSNRNGVNLEDDDPRRLKIKLRPKAEKISIPHKGFFEITVPEDLLKEDEVKLSWVDFYR